MTDYEEDDIKLEDNDEEFDSIVYTEKVISYIYNINIDTDIEEPDKYRKVYNVLRKATNMDLINFHINSVGGTIPTFIQMYNLMLTTQAKTVAYVYSAVSAAALLALSCDEIVVTEFSSMMFHSCSWDIAGSADEIKGQSDFFSEWTKEIITTVCKGFLTDKEIEKVLDNKELWFNSKEIRKRLENREKFLKRK
jgi:ATP-dependent protease ClpP protease subunit